PAGRVRHVRVDDALDAPRGLGDADTQRLGDLTPDRLARAVDVERHAPAREPGRRDVAEDGVGVGDGRERPAPPVTDRTRSRARALGADEQRTLPNPRDRPAARA